MSKKEVCLASSSGGNEYVCLVNYFASKNKKEVYAQCPAREDFGLCIESFEKRNITKLVPPPEFEAKR